MIFDMPTFTKFVRRAHGQLISQGRTAFSLDEVLEVFRLYFDWYEYATGRVHPNLRLPQIEQIVCAMPCLNDASLDDRMFAIDLGHYEEMIPQHFKTRYHNCDYNINHFFSGDIRMLRFYEICH